MKKLFVFSLVALAAPVLLAAKGKTVRVVLEGADLATPLEMTEPGIEVFGVWEGPGVRAAGVAQSEGFIIDWSHGTVSDRPAGLRQYKASFYVKRDAEERLAYSVAYEYDPATGEGYVYLTPSRLNTRSIYRGVEGNWFLATAEWQEAVRDALGL